MDRLTQAQQDLVAQYIPLVMARVRRQMEQMPPGRPGCEHDDLVQEGMLGLMMAARRYDPKRCGPFCSYAGTYIHGALCRYLLRQMDGLAVPERTARQLVHQRRQAAALAAGREDRPPQAVTGPVGVPLPRLFDLESAEASLARLACRRAGRAARDSDGKQAGPGWTNERLHLRYRQALGWAMGQVRGSPGARPDHAALVQAIIQERLLVPDEDYRTPRRVLAKRFGCARARIDNVEGRLVRLVYRYMAQRAGLSHEAATLICRAARTPGLHSPRTESASLAVTFPPAGA